MIHVMSFVFGLFLGSFINVLIDRLPEGENVLVGRSRCDYCQKKLTWRELIPVLSYVLLHGKSHCCKKSLSIQYPLIEIITGGMCWFIVGSFFPDALLITSLLCIYLSLLVIIVTDIKTMIIPDVMVIVGIVGVLLMRFYEKVTFIELVYEYVVPGIVVSLFFYSLWYFSKGKSMGFGDVKYAFFMGLFLGYPLVIVSLYAAFLTGAIYGVILILSRSKSAKSKVPFGPFLVFGTVLSHIYGAHVIDIWRNFLL